ncbi:MAG: NAD/NADP octopine/nopaline dehydrogenase family protein [Anaerolineales bacterium]|nr:NAD/NADP octopine/nopaline dehydrogenase family protein [Anaerolineales bacterium]
MNKIKNIAVFGSGHGGKAMAAYLALCGARVTLFNRTWKNIEAIKERGGIALNGNSEIIGFGDIPQVTDNIEEAVKSSALLMVVVPAYGHASLAKKMAPHLSDGQIVVLNPGRTFGAIEFQKVLSENGCTQKVILAEAQTFIFASRSVGPAQAFIHRVKEAVPLAAFPADQTQLVLNCLHPYFPQFIDGKTVLHTGMDNIGAVFHPTIMLHNTGWVEASGGDFQFYTQGVTPAIARVMEAIDRERMRIGRALGIHLVTACDWLKMAYEATGEDLYETIRNQQGYRNIQAPPTLNHRYINEDIPMSLVPMASIGHKLGIRVRAMESLIRLASIIRGTDFWEHGRTIERLGLAQFSSEELLAMVTGKLLRPPIHEDTAVKFIPAG